MPLETKLQFQEDHIESLRSLLSLRCLVHGEMVMAVRKNGRILFWCGCQKDLEPFLIEKEI